MTQFLLVTDNRFGVLARIVSIVSSSGVNIQTVAVYPVAESRFSVVHLHLQTGEVMADRIRRKLSRLPQVVDIQVGSTEAPVSLVLSSVRIMGAQRADDSFLDDGSTRVVG